MTTARMRPRLGLTLGQMMKLVVFAAFASAALVPAFEVSQAGNTSLWFGLIIFGGVGVPLAWIVAAILLLRPGLFRDWFIAAMLTLASGIFVAVVGISTFHLLNSLRLYRISLKPSELSWMIPFWAAGVFLAFGLIFLLRRVIPARCPSCRRRRLLLSGRVPAGPEKAYRPRMARCFGCGQAFARRGHAWSNGLEGEIP